jgi:hypothetical protein
MIVNHHSGIQNANFLERTCPILLVDTALSVWESMLFQHDGTHPHSSSEGING